MCALAADPPGGPVLLQAKAWDGANFAGAELVVGAADDMEEARRLASAAQRAGVPVNVIDRPAFSTFCIEALLPAGFARWVEAAHVWRRELRSLKLADAVRRRFWDRFARLALGEPSRTPGASDRDRLLAEAQGGGHRRGHGLHHGLHHGL